LAVLASRPSPIAHELQQSEIHMAESAKKYRFHLINAFSLSERAAFNLRPYGGPKETILYNYQDLAPFLADVEWDVHPGARATHGDWPVEKQEEFQSVGTNRLPLVRAACESGKYNAIILLGGGDPGYWPAREIGRYYRIPVTSCAHAQMHIARTLGHKFSIIDIAETHNMQMYNLVVQYGFTNECASIRGVNYSLPRPAFPNEPSITAERDKALRRERSDMLEQSLNEAILAIEEDGAEVLMLGCSATFWMQPFLQKRLNEIGWEIPVLEGARCAIELAKTFVNLGVDASGLMLPSERPKKTRRKKVF
jgi:allantoin racemase